METKLIAKQLTLNLFGDKFELYPNGLVVHGEPEESEYDEAFKRLKTIEDATAWWYGDLANARDKQYGSLKEMAERLEINYNALRVYQSIANTYELLMRINSLSFYHHQIAAPWDDRLGWLQQAADNNWSAKELKLNHLSSLIEAPSFDGDAPHIYKQDARLWLPQQPDCDLLLTDPPYSTDIDIAIEDFASWLPIALNKVKSTGRAYIFTGPYPREVFAYLSQLGNKIDNCQLLVWEYRKTMGPSPKYEYKNNWQAIFYYRGPNAPEIESPMLLDQYAVQRYEMPNSSDNPDHHQWEKPIELAENFIKQSTKKGELVLDCFAGTGTFLAAAAKYGRKALGCDIDEGMIKLAVKRGCISES